MDAKRRRLAKWKQAKEAAESSRASSIPESIPESTPASTPESIPESTPASIPASTPASTPASIPAPTPALTQDPRPPLAPPSSLKLNLANLRRKKSGNKRVTLEPDNADHAIGLKDDSIQPKSVDTGFFKPNQTPYESIDDALNSLDSSNVYGAAYFSEDDDDTSEEELVAPRQRTRGVTSKLDTVVANHATESFEKSLFIPQFSTDIDPDAFRSANGIKVDGFNVSPLVSWHTAGLPLPLLRSIEVRGFGSPTPIQAQSLPIIMSGSDLVGIAPTSSGKTIAFLLPLCRHVAANQAQHRKMSKGPYALVLAPTRELCLQIFREVEVMAKSLQLNALGCFGGTDISSQISELINGRCDIMVATPGRLIDLLATNHGRVLTLRGVTFLVVDETDRMFDLGFGPQVRTIVGAIRPDRQTVVFSATMSPGMESLVSRILTNPARVTVGHQATVPSQISQEVMLINDRKDKLSILMRALDAVEPQGLSLVFVDTQERADTITLQLMAKGFKCQALHGGMDQQDRAATIGEFRGGMLPVLVATSIAARGLDVRNVKLVVNFDAASHLEDYVHRAGRTGRGGDKGKCITFLETHQTRHAYELSKLFDVPENVQKLANTYSQSSNKTEPSRLGFGGHGLANLDKKRDHKKTVEHDTYAPKQESQEPEANPKGETKATELSPEPAVVQEGRSFVARLVVNDLPKDARVAVTAAVNQVRISTELGVSITIRGTFYSLPRKDISEEDKLHLFIEGENHNSVLNAVNAFRELAEDANTKQGGRYMVL